MVKFTMIPCVEAKDMPEDVTDYCIDQGLSLHYQNDVVVIHEDDETPLSIWLKHIGICFDFKKYNYVAIIAT